MKKLITLALIFSAFLAQAQAPTLKAGQPAPDFKLKNVDNKEISFASYPEACLKVAQTFGDWSGLDLMR